MTKKIIIYSFVLFFLISLFLPSVKGADIPNTYDVKIILTIGAYTMKVNDNDVKLDVPAEIVNGRTFVPLRAVVNAFPSTSVNYVSETQCASIVFDGKSIDMQVNNVNAIVDGKDIVVLDVAPYIRDSRMMVPVRFISEVLGCKVEWIQETKQVIIENS